MDFIWTPWRYQYIINADKTDGCPFCEKISMGDDRKALIVYRGKHNFIILNLFPYTSGHAMVVPYQHLDSLGALPPEATTEMMELTQRLEGVIRKVYNPHGTNLGMNLGHAAGAGVRGHIHMHVLPRWTGDSSFIGTIAETRVIPENLETTWERIREAWPVDSVR